MEKQFAEIASLIGDPVRSRVLWTLLDGRAYTATELAIVSGTTAQNISMHLARLVQAGLLYVEKQGRHRYFRYAKREVAYAVEALANLINNHEVERRPGVAEDTSAIRYCRTCYDHLAGRLAVSIAGSLLKQQVILLQENRFIISPEGEQWFQELDISVSDLKDQRRTFLRACLDWSERQYHLAGALGAALLQKMLEDDWIRRKRNSRAVVITGRGEKMLYTYFDIVALRR